MRTQTGPWPVRRHRPAHVRMRIESPVCAGDLNLVCPHADARVKKEPHLAIRPQVRMRILNSRGSSRLKLGRPNGDATIAEAGSEDTGLPTSTCGF